MKTIQLSALALLLSTLSAGTFAGETKTDVIKLSAGPVSGKTESGTRVFMGIPYAAPPTGKLRWSPPQEAPAWTEVKLATSFAPSCPQPKQQPDGNFSEDCLYLNVWTPAKKAGERLPVMVWIHGGGFNFGSSSLPEYDGGNLARKGVVVVTINYRLGPLGYLVHPSLSGESEHNVSGNYGLLDQIAALQWVRKNIAAFGGDTEHVTLFGQSAGSRSVSLQMISPLSKGLFHRAIAESGGPIIGSEYLSPNFNGDIENAGAMGQKLAAKLNCDKAADIPACMRAKSAQEVIAAAACKTDLFDDGGMFFAPVFDSWVLPENPLTAYSSGQQHTVPLITGSTLNEGNIYLTNEPNLPVKKYVSFLKTKFPDSYAEALALFPVRQGEYANHALDNFITVAANAQPARLIAQAMKQKKVKAYLYQFTRRPDTAMTRKLGVHHGVELAYVFGNMKKSDGYTDTDLELSHEMMAYWVNFARTGDPNGKGHLNWPQYDGKSDINLEFSDTIRINNHLFRKESDFISRQSIFRTK